MEKLGLERKAWMRSITKLIQSQEYEEACGLTDYFPETTETQFLRCAALTGTANKRRADQMLTEMGLEIDTAARYWAKLFAMNPDLLIEQTIKGAESGCIRLSHLCCEAAMVTESAGEKELVRALCHLVLAALGKNPKYSIGLFLQLEQFDYSKIEEVIHAVYEEYSAWKRQNTLLNLVKHAERIGSKLVMLFLQQLFEFDLGLDSHDLVNIRRQLPTEPTIREIIERGLSKQRIREPVTESAWDAMMAPMYDMMAPMMRELTTTRRIERHTHIQFPSRCELEKKAILNIQLTKDVPTLTRVLKKISVEVGRDVRQIEFDVHVTAPAFALKEHKKAMTMLLEGDSERISFDLFPMESGRQVVEIEIFHKSSRVGYVIVDTYVLRGHATEEPADMAIMEDPIENMDEGMLLDGPHRRILWVAWDQREGKITFDVKSSEPQDSQSYEKAFPQLRKDIEDYLRKLNEFLNEVVIQAQPSDEMWESMCLNLQGYGGYLFEKLIPSEIAEKCEQWKPGTTVIVSTNENWIPWELLFDGQDFWGKKYCMARYPRFTMVDDIPEKSRPKTPALRSAKKALNVIGGDIAKDDSEKAVKLFENLLNGDSVKVLEACSVSVFNDSLPGTDIVHCTCHGRINPHLLQLSDTRSPLENLLPETIRQLSLEEGSFVFANACSSNVPVLTFGQFGSFGWEFYRRGAKIFVGTLGAVPVRYAIPFAESIYAELLSQDGTPTIGQAVTSAKEKASENRNLFWLLYMVYGDPDLNLKVVD